MSESFTVARQKGWMVESDTGYGSRGKVEGGDMFDWMCRINFDMVGLKYVRAK
jgi:hypothetical protein